MRRYIASVFPERRLEISHAIGFWRNGGPSLMIFLSEKRL
jgi:hypothetical protein